MSTEKLYVVIKRGLFWRPEDKGYTSEINEAGRYTKEEAESRCHGGEQPVTMALASSFQTQESLQAEVDALRLAVADAALAEAVSKAQLNLAINRSCSCGGRPPGTPSTCPACEVWHRLFGDLAPPKPVPIDAALHPATKEVKAE